MDIETYNQKEREVKTNLMFLAGFAIGYVAGCLVAFSLV